MANAVRSNHLELMANELKCPICLSLLKQAASLSCNHVFCTECITTSMKAACSCPVCKVPTNRREVRSAPQMDNLVHIYRKMEAEVAPNNSQSLNGSELENSRGTDSSKLKAGDTEITPASKKGKPLGRIPSKRRVQAPRHENKRARTPVSERKTKRTKRERVAPLDEDVQAATAPGLNDFEDFNSGLQTPAKAWELKACSRNPNEGEKLDKNGGLLPFFWLSESPERDDDLVKRMEDDQHSTPSAAVPAFSDLKDSQDVLRADENEDEVEKVSTWTQRPSSPEFCCFPDLNKQVIADSEPEEEFGDEQLKNTEEEQAEQIETKNLISASGKPKPDTPCAFCQKSGDCKFAGEMMYYKDGRLLEQIPSEDSTAVHKYCAEWAPDVYFTEDETEVRNLKSEIVRGQKLKCSVCRLKGAALGCCLKRCRKSFHYPCAKAQDDCSWDEDKYLMHCPDHASCKFPGRKTASTTVNVEKPSPKPTCISLPSVVAMPKWAPGPPYTWTLCGSALDVQKKEELAKFASISGATLATSWNQKITHVITSTDGDAARRTMKYLRAILEGKWILKSEWISACLSVGRALDEEPFEVACDIHGIYGGPKEGRAIAASGAPKLFSGLSFYFTASFEGTLKADLQALVQVGGGVVLQRKPIILSAAGLTGTVMVIFYDDVSTPKFELRKEEAELIADTAGAVALGHSWILDSAAGCKLRPMT